RPERISAASVTDYGYSGAVLLMAPITAAPKADKQAEIGARVDWLVCREICIPGKAQLGLTLSVGGRPQMDPSQHAAFQTARAQWPQPAPANWHASAQMKNDEFIIMVETGKAGKAVEFLPLQPEQI